MTQKTQKKFMLQSLLVGIGTTLTYSITSAEGQIYSQLFKSGISTRIIWALWWGVFVLPYLILKIDNSSITSFFMITLFYIVGFFIPEFGNRHFLIDYIVFRLTIPEMIYSIFIGILTGIYYSSQKRIRAKMDDEDQNAFISKLKQIYKPYSILTPAILIGCVVYYFNDQSYTIFEDGASTILILSSIIFFLLLIQDFHFIKAILLDFIIELCIFTFIGIFGLQIPAMHNPAYGRYVNYSAFFKQFSEVFYIQIICLVFLITLQIGCIISEIPAVITNSRFDRKLKRLEKKAMRMYATSKSEKEIPLRSDRTVKPPYTLFSGYDRADYQKYQELRKIEESLIKEEKRFVKSQNSKSISKLFSIPLPKTAFIEDSSLDNKTSKKGDQNIEIGTAEINMKNYIHYLFNGSWLSSLAISILASMSFLYITFLGLNRFNWGILPFAYIPVGLITIFTLIILFIPTHPNSLKDYFKNGKKDYSLLIFLSSVVLNIAFSIIFPPIGIVLIIIEIYLINPFMSAQLQKKQKQAQKIESPLFDLIHGIRLIIWPVIIFNTMIYPNQFILHLISFLIFVLLQSAFLFIKIGWNDGKYFLISDFIISFGLIFFSILLNMQGWEFLQVLSIIFGVIVLSLSGVIFQIQYFNIKIYSEGFFKPISGEMNLWLENYDKIRHNKKINRSLLRQNKLKVKQEELDLKQEELKYQQEKLRQEQNEFYYNSIQDQNTSIPQKGSSFPKEKAEYMCPICKEMLEFTAKEIEILQEQEYLFCPNCREKVSLNEILEPSFNSLIFEHRKILEDVESKRIKMSEENTNSNDAINSRFHQQNLTQHKGK
ncbi:hypothetical protein NEF87_000972 [Candidatus Lokiarchaeum ossiferum]|uniref:MFS transporter n=1 Tax=Candidatus Lokiarchaeum ossiferum TaxID=2951803 RepID=A0ABY6HMF2_9ARCH|nr:hypothetical protein NEF87_000972 [Candidatus Lokiarchaeum sp. B-35]